MLASGTLKELCAHITSEIPVTIRAERVPDMPALKKEGDGIYTALVREEEEIPGIVKAIVEAGGSIYHVSAGVLTLEEIYFRLLETSGEREAAQ